MSEPENFLSRWSRRKRESDALPDTETAAQPAPAKDTAAPDAVPEPEFDVASLPSIESIVAETDVSMFMKPGVPAALRHAALRRAWASDPAIRDFRGLQENDWDFTAPDGIPGFGTFKSDDEIKALAQRLFGSERRTPDAVSQSAPTDNDAAPRAEEPAVTDAESDAVSASQGDPALGHDTSSAVQQNDGAATQRVAGRRHGSALPE